MPGGDGTGPFGQGPGTGRGQGRGGGGGRMGGNCICPSCGTKARHKQGVPCSTVQCPKCGNPMMRE